MQEAQVERALHAFTPGNGRVLVADNTSGEWVSFVADGEFPEIGSEFASKPLEELRSFAIESSLTGHDISSSCLEDKSISTYILRCVLGRFNTVTAEALEEVFRVLTPTPMGKLILAVSYPNLWKRLRGCISSGKKLYRVWSKTYRHSSSQKDVVSRLQAARFRVLSVRRIGLESGSDWRIGAAGVTKRAQPKTLTTVAAATYNGCHQVWESFARRVPVPLTSHTLLVVAEPLKDHDAVRVYGKALDCQSLRRREASLAYTLRGIEFEGKHVVDIGAGSCWVAGFLTKWYVTTRVDCVDFAPELPDVGTLGIAGLGGDPSRCRFFVQDFRDMDHLPCKYDVAMCVESLHHTREKVRLMEAIRRIMKDDGICVVIEPVLPRFGTRRAWLHYERFRFSGHIEEPVTLEEYKMVFRLANFDVMEVRRDEIRTQPCRLRWSGMRRFIREVVSETRDYKRSSSRMFVLRKCTTVDNVQ